jgi:hypothetical protein
MSEKKSKVIIDLATLPPHIGFHDAYGHIDVTISEYVLVQEWIDSKIDAATETAPPEIIFKGWCPVGLAFSLGAIMGAYYLEGRISGFSVTVMKNRINIPVCGGDGFVLTEVDYETHFSAQKDDLTINEIQESNPIGGTNS